MQCTYFLNYSRREVQRALSSGPFIFEFITYYREQYLRDVAEYIGVDFDDFVGVIKLFYEHFPNDSIERIFSKTVTCLDFNFFQYEKLLDYLGLDCVKLDQETYDPSINVFGRVYCANSNIYNFYPPGTEDYFTILYKGQFYKIPRKLSTKSRIYLDLGYIEPFGFLIPLDEDRFTLLLKEHALENNTYNPFLIPGIIQFSKVKFLTDVLSLKGVVNFCFGWDQKLVKIEDPEVLYYKLKECFEMKYRKFSAWEFNLSYSLDWNEFQLNNIPLVYTASFSNLAWFVNRLNAYLNTLNDHEKTLIKEFIRWRAYSLIVKENPFCEFKYKKDSTTLLYDHYFGPRVSQIF